MMSSMHTKAITISTLLVSAVAGGATLAQSSGPGGPPQAAQSYPMPQMPRPLDRAPLPNPYASPRIASALAQWNSLRQTDGLPFSSYASFLRAYPGWPGETALRKTAERAIRPETSPNEVVSYFRALPPLTATGHARHASALLGLGQIDQARTAARAAWAGGLLPRTDEDLLLGRFGAALTTVDHERRIEILLAAGGRESREAAQRLIYFATPGRRPVYEARVALQTNASDAGQRLGLIGSAASSDPGVIADRANWLRNSGQGVAARSLLAQPRRLSSLPADPEQWYEALLVMAQAAAADRNWLTAYQIASQVDDAYPAGTDVRTRSTGERDDYTSLAWLAGTTALHRLNRPADAADMFVRYARAGQSAQVLTKGYYWAGRALASAGQAERAAGYFEQASAYPELFYGQLALERLGRAVPAPPLTPAYAPTPAERAAFQRSDLVEATRHLGLTGRWEDQSLFVRALAESERESDRALAAELSRQIGRPDLGVWLARNGRNAGAPFYVRAAYPEVNVPPAQSHLWSLAHGIIRQESSFDRAAVSHAGARGMMQLMTPTARETAGKMGLPYEMGRLTRDPSYNIMLGSRYFAMLMDQWGGYAPLAVASYNAGSGNVRKWIAAYGDPRLPGSDIARWIEDIPFSETRGYVQRVLENAVVYDAISPARTQGRESNRLSYYLGKSGRPG